MKKNNIIKDKKNRVINKISCIEYHIKKCVKTYLINIHKDKNMEFNYSNNNSIITNNDSTILEISGIKTQIDQIPLLESNPEYTEFDELKVNKQEYIHNELENVNNLNNKIYSNNNFNSLYKEQIYEKDIEKLSEFNDISYLLPVSVAESVTAGALSNILCSDPGSSKFFLGGIVAYNMKTQEKLLNIDAKYAEMNNFANPFTTLNMAQSVTKIFESRIGLSTTGFSLPLFREANLEDGKCEINVKIPYAYICLYDSYNEYNKIYKIVNYEYEENGNQKIQRAEMQSKVALECKRMFIEYCKTLK